MNRIKRLLFFLTAASCTSGAAFAQFNDSGISAGFFDSSGEKSINFSEFHLPPLAVLFENAKSTPAVQMLSKKQEMAEAEVEKQRKHIFSYVYGHASYSYGKTDMWGNNSSTYSTMIYQFQGNEQSYWNVGINLSVPLEDILDLSAAVRRKKLEVDYAMEEKDKAFDELKFEIASLYISITNNLVALKTASENAAMYQGAGSLNLQDFLNGNMNIEDFAWTKLHEESAVTKYQQLQTTITTDIMKLEIITHTPILTNSTTEITIDSAVKKTDKDLERENEAVKKRVKKAAEEEQKKIAALEKEEAKMKKAAEKAAKKSNK